MSISCTYPDRKVDMDAMCSSTFAEKVANFDLEYQYTLLLEEEICLFFATLFNIDLLSTPADDLMKKGKISTNKVDSIIYYWDDIPMISFKLIPSYEGYYGCDIECTRLYTLDEKYHS